MHARTHIYTHSLLPEAAGSWSYLLAPSSELTVEIGGERTLCGVSRPTDATQLLQIAKCVFLFYCILHFTVSVTVTVLLSTPKPSGASGNTWRERENKLI